MSIIYALASDDPPRPLSVTVNGQISQQGMDGSSVNFPATGAWTEWGRVYVPVLLHSGANEITLSAIANSGPNIVRASLSVCAAWRCDCRRMCRFLIGPPTALCSHLAFPSRQPLTSSTVNAVACLGLDRNLPAALYRDR